MAVSKAYNMYHVDKTSMNENSLYSLVYVNTLKICNAFHDDLEREMSFAMSNVSSLDYRSEPNSEEVLPFFELQMELFQKCEFAKDVFEKLKRLATGPITSEDKKIVARFNDYAMLILLGMFYGVNIVIFDEHALQSTLIKLVNSDFIMSFRVGNSTRGTFERFLAPPNFVMNCHPGERLTTHHAALCKEIRFGNLLKFLTMTTVCLESQTCMTASLEASPDLLACDLNFRKLLYETPESTLQYRKQMYAPKPQHDSDKIFTDMDLCTMYHRYYSMSSKERAVFKEHIIIDPPKVMCDQYNVGVTVLNSQLNADDTYSKYGPKPLKTVRTGVVSARSGLYYLSRNYLANDHSDNTNHFQRIVNTFGVFNEYGRITNIIVVYQSLDLLSLDFLPTYTYSVSYDEDLNYVTFIFMYAEHTLQKDINFIEYLSPLVWEYEIDVTNAVGMITDMLRQSEMDRVDDDDYLTKVTYVLYPTASQKPAKDSFFYDEEDEQSFEVHLNIIKPMERYPSYITFARNDISGLEQYDFGLPTYLRYSLGLRHGFNNFNELQGSKRLTSFRYMCTAIFDSITINHERTHIVMPCGMICLLSNPMLHLHQCLIKHHAIKTTFNSNVIQSKSQLYTCDDCNRVYYWHLLAKVCCHEDREQVQASIFEYV